MKTDALFYELFNVDPQSLFRLVQLEIEGEYTFESITIKTTEKRFDGFCKRTDGTGPNVFVEIQGYYDPKIYWRALREVCTYYEQNDDPTPFVLIVLFLDEDYDPGKFPLSQVQPPHQFIRANLVDCLRAIWNNAGTLTVLKPLAIARREQILEEFQQWKADIYSLPLAEHHINHLIGLLEYLILQRFPEMTLKEVETMLQLTPLEKTVAGQELIQIGHKEGVNKGELIGEIRATQKFLKHPVSSIEELVRKNLKELKMMLQQLEAELN